MFRRLLDAALLNLLLLVLIHIVPLTARCVLATRRYRYRPVNDPNVVVRVLAEMFE